jgi:hypothetical protein
VAKIEAGGRLAEYRELWKSKPVLRRLYEDDYAILSRMTAGRTLEIGGGSGNLKAYRRDIITMDIQPAPWLNLIANAHRLPFANASFDNIVMFDVLPHWDCP